MNAPDPNAFSLDMNDPEDAELVEYFLSELPSRVDTIIAAFSNDDFAELARVAHQLKGAGGSYGFPQITELARALEERADSADVDAVRQSIDDLIAICNRTSV